MNDKLEKLIAKSEIYDLSCKYMRGLDRLDIELLKSVFHEDAWCDYGFIKSDAFKFTQFCMDALKEHHANHHMIGNILIEFSDNEKKQIHISIKELEEQLKLFKKLISIK